MHDVLCVSLVLTSCFTICMFVACWLIKPIHSLHVQTFYSFLFKVVRTTTNSTCLYTHKHTLDNVNVWTVRIVSQESFCVSPERFLDLAFYNGWWCVLWNSPMQAQAVCISCGISVVIRGHSSLPCFTAHTSHRPNGFDYIGTLLYLEVRCGPLSVCGGEGREPWCCILCQSWCIISSIFLCTLYNKMYMFMQTRPPDACSAFLNLASNSALVIQTHLSFTGKCCFHRQIKFTNSLN